MAPIAHEQRAGGSGAAGRSRRPEWTLPLAEYTLGGYGSRMQSETKAGCLRRLKRIEGQVRGLSRMVEENRYCIDVITHNPETAARQLEL